MTIVESDATGRAAEPEHAAAGPSVTVVVPTRNEAGNIAPLVDRLDTALAGLSADVLFVDDSDDGTADAIAAAALVAEHPVRAHVRLPAQRRNGLAGAVTEGLRTATSEWVVVMDGDLQHPPEVVPALVDAGVTTGADVVVATRYVDNGSAGGLEGGVRHSTSRAATAVTKAMFPRHMRHVSDPMSGFFAVRRSAIDPATLHAVGFKILLEILVRSRARAVEEVPFTFAQRHAGHSKASVREGLRFLRHLARLRVSTVSSRVRRLAGFGAVGASGIAVNSAALAMLAGPAHLHYLLAATLATQASTTWNFLWLDRVVFAGAKRHAPLWRFLSFAAVNNALLLLRLPLLGLLVSVVGIGYLVANALTLALLFASRFVTSERLVYAEESP